MGINAFVHSYLAKDYHTETQGTAIDESVAGQNGKRLALVGVDYLCGSTAQTMNVMHCGSVAGSRNTTSAAAAISQAVINVTTSPTDPAGNATASGDIIAYQVTGGGWEFNTVASLSTLAITMNNNVAIAVLSGAAVRIFGVVGDNYSFVIGLKASTQINYRDTIICQAPFKGDPLYVTNANATAASFQNNLLFAFINK